MEAMGAHGMTSMDHSTMEGMDHSGMSNMQGMDHASMEEMDHSAMSNMEGMDHSNMEGIDHSDMSGMNNMDHSNGMAGEQRNMLASGMLAAGDAQPGSRYGQVGIGIDPDERRVLVYRDLKAFRHGPTAASPDASLNCTSPATWNATCGRSTARSLAK